jgi:hypothetical protein
VGAPIFPVLRLLPTRPPGQSDSAALLVPLPYPVVLLALVFIDKAPCWTSPQRPVGLNLILVSPRLVVRGVQVVPRPATVGRPVVVPRENTLSVLESLEEREASEDREAAQRRPWQGRRGPQ